MTEQHTTYTECSAINMQKFHYCEKYGGRVEACPCIDCELQRAKWYQDFRTKFKDMEKLCYHELQPSITTDGTVLDSVVCIKCYHSMGLGT